MRLTALITIDYNSNIIEKAIRKIKKFKISNIFNPQIKLSPYHKVDKWGIREYSLGNQDESITRGSGRLRELAIFR